MIPARFAGDRSSIDEIHNLRDPLTQLPAETCAPRLPDAHPKSDAERQSIRHLAEAITRIVESEVFDVWNLAAPSSVCDQLLVHLPLCIKETLTRVDKSDCTTLGVNRIEELFS